MFILNVMRWIAARFEEPRTQQSHTYVAAQITDKHPRNP